MTRVPSLPLLMMTFLATPAGASELTGEETVLELYAHQMEAKEQIGTLDKEVESFQVLDDDIQAALRRISKLKGEEPGDLGSILDEVRKEAEPPKPSKDPVEPGPAPEADADTGFGYSSTDSVQALDEFCITDLLGATRRLRGGEFDEFEIRALSDYGYVSGPVPSHGGAAARRRQQISDDLDTVIRPVHRRLDQLNDAVIEHRHDAVDQYLTFFTTDRCADLLDDVAQELTAQHEEIEAILTGLRTTRDQSAKEFKDIDRKLSAQSRLDDRLVTVSLPIFCVTIILLFLIPRSFPKELQKSVYSGVVLDLITVFLLIVAILMLGMSDRIDSQVLGTLMSGISGYVLGRGARSQAQRELALPGGGPPSAPQGGVTLASGSLTPTQ